MAVMDASVWIMVGRLGSCSVTTGSDDRHLFRSKYAFWCSRVHTRPNASPDRFFPVRPISGAARSAYLGTSLA